MPAKGLDRADSPTSTDVPDDLRVTPPAVLALARLLGRLAANQAQESTPDQELE